MYRKSLPLLITSIAMLVIIFVYISAFCQFIKAIIECCAMEGYMKWMIKAIAELVREGTNTREAPYKLFYK